jgi:hypothetical protein
MLINGRSTPSNPLSTAEVELQEVLEKEDN